MKPVISLHLIEPTFYELLSPQIVSPISSCVIDEDSKMDEETNSQHQFRLHRWAKKARKCLIHIKQNTESSQVIKFFWKEAIFLLKILICRVSMRILILFIACAIKRQWQYCLINRLSTGDPNSCPEILCVSVTILYWSYSEIICLNAYL
jgi:hypothetical protein